MNEMPEAQEGLPDRWTLIRDVAVLQVKLVVDGLRDLILVPLSLAAGIVSLASGENGVPGTQFYRLLGVGKQSELWINLFGAMKNAPPDLEHPMPFPDSDMDEIFGRIEAFVVDEEKRGGMTAQARKRFDKAIDAMQKRR
jgi:hypothetical protein